MNEKYNGLKIVFSKWETYEYALERFKGWVKAVRPGTILSFFVYGEGTINIDAMHNAYSEEEVIKYLKEERLEIAQKKDKTGVDFANMMQIVVELDAFAKKNLKEEQK